ncbi:MAG: putative cytokinetic ring protein SteA [Nocardioides sp.]|nr:putative cytokinetic ring protein SteA [Nocardioides sp.]
MRLPTRQDRRTALPGITGTVRVERRARNLVPRLQPGDIAVLDHLDLDRTTAQQFVDAEVVAVVNASRFVSGRYPALGATILIDAGILLVDGIGPEALSALKDGRNARLHQDGLFDGEDELARGDVLDDDRLTAELGEARSGMISQLESFTHNSTEFLRQEQELFLHDKGAPRLGTRLRDRPVVVVVPGPDHAEELKGIKAYLREQKPVLIAVDRGADALLAAGHAPDVIVLTSPLSTGRESVDVSAKALRAAKDVVLVVDRGSGTTPTDSLERMGVRSLRFETGATTEDAALVLGFLGHASLIVGVGVHTSLDDFLDRQRGGLSSTFLTRLKVGAQLVDARAIPALYSGRVRLWQVLLVLLVGLLAVAAAIAVTPVGQDWIDRAPDAADHLIDRIQGLFS